MKWSWSDNNEQQEPKQRFNPNKYNNQKSGNQMENTGDLHTLMEQAEKIKESLEKALKQQETNCRNRKSKENHVTFSEDNAIVKEEAQEDKNNNFFSELDQLLLNEDDLKDYLWKLSDLKARWNLRIGAGKTENRFMNNTSIDVVINKSFLSHLTLAKASNTKRRKIVYK